MLNKSSVLFGYFYLGLKPCVIIIVSYMYMGLQCIDLILNGLCMLTCLILTAVLYDEHYY